MNDNNLNSIFEEFTNQYQTQKTLRFELLPIGATAEHIKQQGVIYSSDWQDGIKKALGKDAQFF